MLQRLGLVTLNDLDDGRVQLTGKGRLCVEEISSLFHCPDITEENTTTAERALLDKHNFAPTYPGAIGGQLNKRKSASIRVASA
jgi:hypothetical protein